MRQVKCSSRSECDDRLGERDRARLDRIGVGIFSLDQNCAKNVEIVSRKIDLSEFLKNAVIAGAADFVERAGRVARCRDRPIFADSMRRPISRACEGHFLGDRSAVVGMFFYERDKNFMREWTWLAVVRIGADGDVPLLDRHD